MASPDWSPLVEYSKSLDCIHCGLCLESCPTYRLTGRESASPRGRVHLMRSLGEGRIEPDQGFVDELDGCLLCRRCESVCPAGVDFGAMLEHTRDGLEGVRKSSPYRDFQRWLGFRLLLPHRPLLQLAAATLRLGQRTGLLERLAPLLPASLPDPRQLPPIPPAAERRALPRRTPARRPRPALLPERVLVLEGCLMPVLFGRVNRATVDALAELGVEAVSPPRSGCCGALHAHNGDLEEARRLAVAMIEAFELPDDPAVPILINSAGCGSHMKDLPQLFQPMDPLHARAHAFSARVVDFAELLAPALDAAARPLPEVAHAGASGSPRPPAGPRIGAGSASPDAGSAGTREDQASEPGTAGSSGRVMPDATRQEAKARTAADAGGSRFAGRAGLASRLGLEPGSKVTWDDPCHLCHGQGIRDQPRTLLDAALAGSGLERVELFDSEGCCGSAGIYSILQPEASLEILDSKLDELERTGATLLVTANPGCQLQWQQGVTRRGLAIEVRHLAEVVALALGDPETRQRYRIKTAGPAGLRVGSA
ncbi:MAG: (Fe-S)-binding protein, partial [Planctomycetota bacterium]|nr:(Fe-S)-binding protein [Planctomycetota bacterium]